MLVIRKEGMSLVIRKATRVIEPLDVIITDGGRKAAGFTGKSNHEHDVRVNEEYGQTQACKSTTE